MRTRQVLSLTVLVNFAYNKFKRSLSARQIPQPVFQEARHGL